MPVFIDESVYSANGHRKSARGRAREMAFQTPITIKAALESIHNHRFALPAIQREFVWRPDQIVRLFDSVMRDYPIGAFLFWRVEPRRVKEYAWYEFVTDFHQRDSPHCGDFKVTNPELGLTAILDGQQRLTALNVGSTGATLPSVKGSGGTTRRRSPRPNYISTSLSQHQTAKAVPSTTWVRLFFVEEFLPYSWAFLPADASLQCSFRGDSNQASAYPRLSGGQPSLETVPNTVGLSPSGALPSGHSRGVLVRCRGNGGRPAMAVTTGFQGRTFDVPRTGVPCIDLPSRAPCAAADAVFADAKAFLSSSEARQMSESELERELHRRRQDLARKLLQGHRDQRSPKEAAGPAEDTSGVECSEPREHESHAETTSGTMQVVGLGCARRGHDGLHRLDAALNLLPERYLVEMRRRVTIATASRAPPRTPWKPQWYSTSSTWQRRRGVRCSSSAHRRACRHLVRDPMGVDRRTVTLGCSCGGSQPPQAAGALMRTETSHEAREDQRKSPIGR